MASPKVPPHLFVVLGATGDLMQRKLLPALYRLRSRGEFPEGSLVLGVARRPADDAWFRSEGLASLTAAQAGDAGALGKFCAESLFYQPLTGSPTEAYAALKTRIEQLEGSHGLAGDRIFYLALPLEAFAPTLEGLGEAGLATGKGFTRVVIEKPFGSDLASAEALNQLAHRYFGEPQIYRIDHYLGKETVQNLLVFRFANMFVESNWNRERIEHVEVTVAESLGVEGRAGYYETSGALRDMVQNHVVQLLTLVAMEPPAMRNEESIRNEKVKVLRSAVRLEPGDAVRGQYGPGTVGGQPVAGYRQEPGVAADSNVETYLALRVKVANWRWQGVPFFIRTGKRLATKSTRVVVTFKAPPVSFFQTEAEYNVSPDRVTILIQPEEGFELAFEVKVPGHEMRVQTHRMKFHYADVFGVLPDGYETLVSDVMRGDASLFVRADEVEEAWRFVAPILEHPTPVVLYPAGSDGPPEADRLAEEWGHRWNVD